MAKRWLADAIMVREKDHARGLHNLASDTQSAIDRALDAGKVTEKDLLAAGREAAARLRAGR